MAVGEAAVSCVALKAAAVSQGGLGSFWDIPLGNAVLESWR